MPISTSGSNGGIGFTRDVASYIGRILCKSRLILFRINGPINALEKVLKRASWCVIRSKEGQEMSCEKRSKIH